VRAFTAGWWIGSHTIPFGTPSSGLTAIVTDPRRDETTVFPRSNDSMYSSVVSG